ncbi:hypothetical protein MSG28_001060 [Choristoneura fumiferana]|uniref:Uncharacterized protein n=1 Tax=Choristoneura fumiferana TaxID=7141 RepID=A0ACC0K3J4_CHOFU|nr:hypothetical protein MSG28_001060 [Choristoneura fumiferana]
MISKSMVVLSVLLILTYNVMSETETIEKVEEKLGSPANSPVIGSDHEDQEAWAFHDSTHHGFWKKKFAWRPRWVKTWQEKKVYVAVWKRMWGPLEVNEWVPLPKPPPGWIKHDVSSYVVKGHPH